MRLKREGKFQLAKKTAQFFFRLNFSLSINRLFPTRVQSSKYRPYRKLHPSNLAQRDPFPRESIHFSYLINHSNRVSINVSKVPVESSSRVSGNVTTLIIIRILDAGGRLHAGGPPRGLRRSGQSGLLGSSGDASVLARGHQGAVLHHQPAAGRRREVRWRLLRMPVDEGPLAVHLHQELDPVGVRA